MLENLLSGESSQTSPATGRLNHPDDIKKYFSSKTYRERLLDKDNIVVACTLLMDGKDFLWTSSYEVAINQKTNEHDEFTITVPDDALDSFEGYLMENSKNILGNGVTIKFHQYGEITQTFEGFITKIKNKKENGYGFLEIIGNSPTIFLESGLRSRSFENQTLEQIIAEVCRGGRGEGKISVQKPQHTASIPYTVQYLESNYAFVQRLAKLYGEYFYYNGSTIIFGNAVQPIITLEDTIELMELETEITTKPQHFGFTAYDSESGGTAEAGSHRASTQYKENPFLHTGMNASKKMYTDKAESHYNPAGLQNADCELGDAARRERENRENLVTVHGKSSSPKLRVGGRARLVDINGHAMETYRILEVRHYHDGNRYYNEFVGIPDLFNAPYQDNFALPLGEAQPARVLDNNDPMGMGRLRVQFPWQVKSGEKTPWIRLVQPHSGSGKGFHFIPEVGEEVMVGFEGGNLQKPFVMGTHYNGAEISGYHTSDNSIKAVRTRSGIETVNNDAEGSWRQSTPDGNFIFQDGNGNTVMNAPKDFTINVGGNFYVNVGQSMSFLVGMKAIYNIGMQMLMNTPILKYLVSENYHLQSPKTLINGDGEIKVEAKEANIVGTQKLFMHSDENAIMNSIGTVEIKGQEGTNNDNIANNYETTKELIKAKVIVHFRPHGNWNGEFGMDWLRSGDSGLIGDKLWIKKILGKHYMESTCMNLFKDTNSWSNFFKTENKQYDKLMKTFTNLQIGWKSTREKPYLYQVPVITLFPNINEAKLSLKLEIQEEPKELIIKPKKKNSGVIFNQTTIPIRKGKYDLNNFLTVKCTKPLTDNLIVDVLSDGEICGQFKILANDDHHIKKINVIIVPVKTKLGSIPRIGKIVSGGDTFFQQNLRQALIKPNIRYLINPLDVTNRTFKDRYSRAGTIYSDDGSLDRSGITLLQHLDTELEKKYPGKYTNFYKLYFIADAYPDPLNPSLVTQGFSNFGTTHGVFFNYHDRSTISHETFHAIGLAHTFDGISSSAKFTYKAQQTDNIMDYSHWSQDINGHPRTPVEGKVLYLWQWLIVNPLIKLKG